MSEALRSNQDLIPILSFQLGEQQYALWITDVIEVAAMVELLEFPTEHEAMIGVINRRGEVLPMLDLRRVFGQNPRPVDASTFFIVSQHGEQMAGLVVDSVHQVKYIKKPSGQEKKTAGKFIERIISHESQLVQILALDALITAFLPDSLEEVYLEGKSQ